MNWLGLVILLIVGASTAMRLEIGMIHTILTSLAILVGSILGIQLSDDIRGLLRSVDSDRAISAAVIMGMVNLTYSSEVGNKFAAKILDSMLDTEKAKKRLEDGLNQSALVGILIGVVDIVPASTMWFVPSNLTSGLGVLELRQASVGD